jgi:hypothetical protein
MLTTRPPKPLLLGLLYIIFSSMFSFHRLKYTRALVSADSVSAFYGSPKINLIIKEIIGSRVSTCMPSDNRP